ncbi:hypothetical protein ACFOD4_18910 [Pseudoroseomonas globiformis]|uniref:Uncharacterized protein n=1 Tax=Teichococcus globiformis TaxID=2307229 RepID=A0ABV7G358_9PROT
MPGQENAPLTLRRAIGNLLRLAEADLRDAQVLAENDATSNALMLVGSAAAWMGRVLTVSATGRYEAEDNSAPDLPGSGPMAVRLRGIAEESAPQPRLLEDGSLRRAPASKGVCGTIERGRTLLLELCRKLDVDLQSRRPAGRTALRQDEPSEGGSSREVASSKGTRRPDSTASPRERPRDAPPRTPAEQPRRVPGLTSKTFWDLMNRWKVPDDRALGLLGKGRGLTAEGRQPRFKLSPAEADMLLALQNIDASLTALAQEPCRWVATPLPAAPFRRSKPLDWMIRRGLVGVRELSQHLLQATLAASVRLE